MIFHFTCACGNALEVEADSEFVAEKGVQRCGWVLGQKGRKFVYRCEACRDENSRILRETSDQEVPR